MMLSRDKGPRDNRGVPNRLLQIYTPLRHGGDRALQLALMVVFLTVAHLLMCTLIHNYCNLHSGVVVVVCGGRVYVMWYSIYKHVVASAPRLLAPLFSSAITQLLPVFVGEFYRLPIPFLLPQGPWLSQRHTH